MRIEYRYVGAKDGNAISFTVVLNSNRKVFWSPDATTVHASLYDTLGRRTTDIVRIVGSSEAALERFGGTTALLAFELCRLSRPAPRRRLWRSWKPIVATCGTYVLEDFVDNPDFRPQAGPTKSLSLAVIENPEITSLNAAWNAFLQSGYQPSQRLTDFP